MLTSAANLCPGAQLQRPLFIRTWWRFYEGGQAAEAIPLQLFRRKGNALELIAETASGVDGLYRLTGFVPGEGLLMAGSPVADPRGGSFVTSVLTSADTMMLNIPLRTGGYRIRGRIRTQNDLPVAKLNWRLGIQAPDSVQGTALSLTPSEYDPTSGIFEIQAILPGLYHLSVSSYEDKAPLSGLCARTKVEVTDADIAGAELSLVTCL